MNFEFSLLRLILTELSYAGSLLRQMTTSFTNQSSCSFISYVTFQMHGMPMYMLYSGGFLSGTIIHYATYFRYVYYSALQ